MCEVMGVGRSGFYAWLKRPPSHRSIENEGLSQDIRRIFTQSKESYGSPRITQQLKAEGKHVSRPRVARLMRKNHLSSRMKRKFVHTTDSNHELEICPDLLQRQFEPGKINRAWVSDITYLYTTEGWQYLTMIMDLGDRKVIGWTLSESMRTEDTVIPAWNMAIGNRTPLPELIFHSDRGVQYAAHDFREALKKQPAIRQSMSRKGNCWDNAVAESFFKSIKNEWLYAKRPLTPKQMRLAVFEYIEIWYNRKRKHSALGYLSPAEFELQLTKIA